VFILPDGPAAPYACAVALYAAYGSNLDPRWMAERCPSSPPISSGWLDGWRLTFGGESVGWEGALATVVEDPYSRVFVMLYEMQLEDERNLDEWEGGSLGLYNKIRVRVQTLEGDSLAWLYVLNDYEGGLPGAHYLEVIAEAAEAAGAPDDYVAALRAHECRSLGE
jgi:gamma-glutamylcyclotransferase (GGCT)/AIG2-like uncharacterized protein YtfP